MTRTNNQLGNSLFILLSLVTYGRLLNHLRLPPIKHSPLALG